MTRGLFEDDRPFESGEMPRGALLARVAVERGVERAEDPAAGLTYAVPPELAPEIRRGDRVRVPLGRGGKIVAGLVLELGHEELLEGLSPSRVRAIEAREGAALPPTLVDLAIWMARYYICPLGMVAATMLPAAVKRAVGRRTRVEVALASPDQRVAALGDAKLTPTMRAALDALDARPELAEGRTAKELARALGLRNVGPVNRLLDMGVLEERSRAIVRSRLGAPESLLESKPNARTLTTGQRKVVQGVASSLGRFETHLLFGVTGSGKTEVYLALIEQLFARSDGSAALVLVPEIGLTPQAVGRFNARFGADSVAVLHSGLAAAERHRQWARVASGEARVIVGARSGVFAPASSLGLVIVDEEHDASYKQDQLPRYHARDVAVKRAQLEDCPVLLGSATPSLESWSNADDAGPRAPRYRLWRLPERVGGAVLPEVRVVDLAIERRRLAQERARADAPPAWPVHERTIGPTLEAAIAGTLSTPGAQAILMLNRRGHASHLACQDAQCGFVHRCNHCDSAMVTHRAAEVPAGRLTRCHHCRAEQTVPARCPVCGKKLRPFGAGTQRVEEEIEALFGDRFGLRRDAGLLRIDADAMAHAGRLTQALSAFARSEARVLLGTQMIAKGLDFPGVRLVGVISADTALAIPDFRASERTFQLVAQVAGRAGRGRDPGAVVVQTSDPSALPIRCAARHDYETFARAELALRREAGLPPSARMARVVVRHTDPDRAAERAGHLADVFRAHADPALLVEGAFPCAVARIADHFRWSIDLIGPDPRVVQRVLAAARREGLVRSDHETAIDVDPVALL